MNDMAVKLTIDSNCLINFFDASNLTATSVESLTLLVRYAMQGEVEIAGTTRIEAALLNDGDQARRERMFRFLLAIPIVGTAFRLDQSKLDRGDALADDDIINIETEIQRILFPGLTQDDVRYENKMNDIDHLVGHFLNKRDIFVTDDKDFLRRKEQLKRSPGLIVMSPQECCDFIDRIVAQKPLRDFPSETIDPEYHSSALRGTVKFDYSNNDHRFAIGEGHWFFETRWSKASNRSIHAFTDSPSIAALALARDVEEIGGIEDIEAFDFSSRVRTPLLGQIVIWQNINDVYAATKIISIKDDSRGDDCDELIFEYIILVDGGTSFREALAGC